MTVEGKPLTLSQKSLYAGPSTRQGGGCCVWPISWNSIFSLAGCQTTESAPAWRDISHQKSNLTIISDYFDVDVVRKREGLESISEVAKLSIAGRRVEFISRQETLGESSGYCGYTVETLLNFLDARKNGFQAILTPQGSRIEIKSSSNFERTSMEIFITLTP